MCGPNKKITLIKKPFKNTLKPKKTKQIKKTNNVKVEPNIKCNSKKSTIEKTMLLHKMDKVKSKTMKNQNRKISVENVSLMITLNDSVKNKIKSLSELLKCIDNIDYDSYEYIEKIYCPDKNVQNCLLDKDLLYPCYLDFTFVCAEKTIDLSKYYKLLMDMTLFFDKNIDLLLHVKYPYWQSIESLSKTTLIIVGEEKTGKTSLLNKLLNLPTLYRKKIPEIDKKKFVVYFSRDPSHVKSPFNPSYVESTSYGRYFKNNYESYVQYVSFNHSFEITKAFQLIDSPFFVETSKNKKMDGEIDVNLNKFYDIVLDRIDVITVVTDHNKISKNFTKLIKKTIPYAEKTMFILNYFESKTSVQNMEIKKEILRWYISHKIQNVTPIKLFCFELKQYEFDFQKPKNVSKYLEYEMTLFYQWLVYYQGSILFYRTKKILEDFKVVISRVLMHQTMVKNEITVFNKNDTKLNKYIDEAKSKAKMLNVLFEKNGVMNEFTLTKLPKNKEWEINKFNQSWDNLPEIKKLVPNDYIFYLCPKDIIFDNNETSIVPSSNNLF